MNNWPMQAMDMTKQFCRNDLLDFNADQADGELVAIGEMERQAQLESQKTLQSSGTLERGSTPSTQMWWPR